MLHRHQEPEQNLLQVPLVQIGEVSQTSEPQHADATSHAPTPPPATSVADATTTDTENVIYSLEIDSASDTTTALPTALSIAVLKDFQLLRNCRTILGVLSASTFAMTQLQGVTRVLLRHAGWYQLWMADIGLILIGLPVIGFFVIVCIAIQTARRLSRLDDGRIIGPLLDAYVYSGLKSQEETLIRLLPHMTTIDARFLTAQNRKQMYQILDKNIGFAGGRHFMPHRYVRRVALSVAILQALERVGTREAIPTVKELIANTKEPRLREAAERCLPYLEMRPQESEASLSLLRGATATDTPDPTLLHPVANSPASDGAEKLLRPTNLAISEKIKETE